MTSEIASHPSSGVPLLSALLGCGLHLLDLNSRKVSRAVAMAEVREVMNLRPLDLIRPFADLARDIAKWA